jgi:hypothetical protein
MGRNCICIFSHTLSLAGGYILPYHSFADSRPLTAHAGIVAWFMAYGIGANGQC